jgi:hypothetical protein
METQLAVVMAHQTVVLVVRMLLQEEVTVTHHGMEVRQVMNIIEVTHAALVEAPIVQVHQMILTTLDLVEMVAQKVAHIQIRLIVAQIAIHLVDITTHVLREQVVHLKVDGQVAVAILRTQAIQEAHHHNRLAGAIAEAVAQTLLLEVAVAQVVAEVVQAAEAAVGQDN